MTARAPLSIISGVAGIGAIQIFGLAFNLATVIILARFFGPEDFGIYAFSIAIGSFCLVLVEFGMPTVALRDVASARGLRDLTALGSYLRWITRFMLASAAVFALVATVALNIGADAIYTVRLGPVAAVIPLVIFWAWLRVGTAMIVGNGDVIVGRVLEVVVRPATILLLFIAVFIGWPEFRNPVFAVALAGVGTAVAFALTIVIARRRFSDIKWRTDAVDRRPTIKSGAWLLIVACADLVGTQIDVIALGFFVEPAEVGIYRVAALLGMLTSFGLTAVYSFVGPRIAETFARGDMGALQSIITQGTLLSIATAVPIFLVLITLGKPILVLLFGAEFVYAYPAMIVLACAHLLRGSVGPVGYLLTLTHREREASLILIATSVLNLLLNVVFITLYGAMGAAFATALSIICTQALFIWAVYKLLKLVPLSL